jgi:release factor glutamine methyltransferase
MDPRTLQTAERNLIEKLNAIYDPREAHAIADLVMEKLTGWKRMDRIINKFNPLSDLTLRQLLIYTQELLNHRPVQYVLKEAWFLGLPFEVNEQVLIPRPETEELANWILESIPMAQPTRVLDLGTGSGCLAVALKKNRPRAELIACDISPQALDIARGNAFTNQVEIEWIELDFLNENERLELPSFNYILSNPPYIPLMDRNTLLPQVLAYEPAQALFVPDSDPFIFYRYIADFGSKKLSSPGEIFVELPETGAASVKKLFLEKKFSKIETRLDMQGKERMLKATWLP